MGERRKRITPELTQTFLDDLNRLPLNIDAAAPEIVFDKTQALCRRHKLTAYDAAYLEIALREGYPLATVDKDLLRAALAEGVTIL